MAVPKSMARRRSASSYEGSHAKVRQGTETPAGKQPAYAFGVLLGQHPGAGWLPKRATSMTRRNGNRESIVPSRQEHERGVSAPIRAVVAAATGTETTTGRKPSIRRPILASSGDAWPPKLQHVASAIVDGTQLPEDSARDGIRNTYSPLDMNGSHVETRDWD